jgi:predicted dehydrogenase
MRVLFVGLGSIAHKHIQAINGISAGAEIFALRSSKKSLSPEGVTSIHALEELKSKPDFVIVSNPTSLHADAIMQAARLEVPMLIEKPLFHSLDKAQEVMDVLNRKKITTYVACNLRFHPAIAFLREYLQNSNKRVNEVNIYCGSYLPDWRPGRDFRTIYSANAEQGGGVHLDLIHEIDYCCWLFGIPPQTKTIRRNASSLGITATDYAHYNLLYDGFVATITLNYYRRDATRTIEILFDDTTWTLDLNRCTITDALGAKVFSADFKMSDTYIDQMKYFMRYVKERGTPMNSANEALEILKICLSHD